MANVRISQLPTAPEPISGSELVPVVQNGQTVQTTVADIISSPSLTQTFITVNNESSLPNSRYLATGSGLALTDGGAQSTYSIGLTGAISTINALSNGVLVKSGSTVVNRSVDVSGAGLGITNGDGVAGNPTIALTGNVLTLASSAGSGLVAINGASSLSILSIIGTSDQISVANGNGASGSPTIGLANNPILPGTASVTIPAGGTAQRPVGVNGMLRYNSDLNSLEVFANSAWGTIISGAGVSSFSAGSTGFTPSTSTTGAVVLAGTLNVASGGTGANTLTGYVKGNGTSAMTANATVPTTDLSGTITNAQLANSSLSIGSTTISLGASTSTLAGLTSVTVTQDPTAGLQLATKQYVDSVAQGLDAKASVVNASTGAFTATYSNGTAGVGATLTNAGALVAFSADGVTNSVGDRVLIKDQATQAQNGIYTVTTAGSGSVAWVLTRATDMNTWVQVPNSFVFVESGNTLADTGWVCTSNAGGTMGTTAITWVQFSGAGTYTAGTGLTLTGSQFSLTSPVVSTLGGTGFTSYAVGDILYASTTTALSKLADVATGNALISGGVGVAPSYGKIGLTTHVSGTLPVGNGGTGLTTLTANYIPYGNGTSAFQSSANHTFDGTTLTLGNAGVTARFQGDFSNATVASRTAFITGTTNGSTGIYALPNGTSTAASWQATNASDPTNASKIIIATNGSTDVQLVSGINGTGTYLPLAFYNNGLGRFVIGTAGQFGIGPTASVSYGTTGQVFTSGGASAPPTWSTLSSVAVTTFQTSLSGLTPSVATSGAITLAGTLGVASGGTGLTTLTANYIPYGNGTSALQSSSNLQFNGTTLTANTLNLTNQLAVQYGGTGLTSLTANYIPYGNGTSALQSSSSFTFNGTTLSAPNYLGTGSITSSSSTGIYAYGTLGYSDVNHILTMQSSQNGYIQMEIQNTNTGASASSDVIVGNNNSTASTYYGDFGMNSSGWVGVAGTNSFGAPNMVYLTATTSDLLIGTTTSNAIRFAVGGGSDAMTIATTGAVTVNNSLTATGGISGGTF